MEEHISFAELSTIPIYKCDALLFWFGSQQNGYTLKASPKSIQLQLECWYFENFFVFLQIKKKKF